MKLKDLFSFGKTNVESEVKIHPPSVHANIRGVDAKESSTLGLDQEFNYAVAGSIMGATGIPQPRKLMAYEDYARIYGSSAWVYIAVYQIAVSIASVPLILMKKPTTRSGKIEIVDDLEHPILKLFDNPNPYMSRFDLFESLVASLELTGNGYLEEVGRQDNLPKEIHPLQSQKMTIIPGKKELIKGYAYTAMGQSVSFAPEEITHIKYFNAESDFYGCPALASVELAVLSDIKASTWNKKFFDNSARPDAVLETESSLNDKLISRFKKQWQAIHGGVSKAHKIAILEGGMKYKSMQLSQKDMEFIQLRQFNRQEIFSAFGFPEQLLGLGEMNNAVMSEIRRNYWENTVLPKMAKIMNAINSEIVQVGWPEYQLAFDLDAVEALKESREARARTSAILVDRGIMTANEVREKFFNLPSVPWGDVWYMPLNLVPVDKAGQGLPPGNPIGRQPATASIHPSYVGENGEIVIGDYHKFFEEMFETVKQASSKDSEHLPLVLDRTDASQITARKEAFEKMRMGFEDEFTAILTKLFAQQEQAVLQAVKSGKNVKQVMDVIDSDKIKFRNEAESFYKKVLPIVGQQTMNEIRALVEINAKED